MSTQLSWLSCLERPRLLLRYTVLVRNEHEHALACVGMNVQFFGLQFLWISR